jgi:acetyl esterase/lipase
VVIQPPYLGWAFLATSLVGLLLAVNVSRPASAPQALAILSFFGGWLVGELPLHVAAVQLVSAAWFVHAGVLSAWPGVVALAATGTSCALLIAVLRRANGARTECDRALRDGLGDTYDISITDEARPWLARALDWRTIALPFPVRHRAVRCTRHVEFHQEAGGSLRLDVHRSRTLRTRGPVLVYLHGGAWIIGHRERQGLPLLQHLAARGWVCFSADYRLSPRATFPDHLVDVKRVLAWVKAHAADYGADSDFVVIAGNSAGAHLAALAALTANDPEYQPGFEASDTSVAACLGFYGVYDFLDRHGHWPHGGMQRLLERHVMKARRTDARDAFEKASPIDRVHAGAPPFLLVHGERDTLVPVAEARRFFEALRVVSRSPVAYAEIAGAQHAFEIFPSLRTANVLDGVTRFLAFVHGNRPDRAAQPAHAPGSSLSACSDARSFARRSAKRSAPA